MKTYESIEDIFFTMVQNVNEEKIAFLKHIIIQVLVRNFFLVINTKKNINDKKKKQKKL